MFGTINLWHSGCYPPQGHPIRRKHGLRPLVWAILAVVCAVYTALFLGLGAVVSFGVLFWNPRLHLTGPWQIPVVIGSVMMVVSIFVASFKGYATNEFYSHFETARKALGLGLTEFQLYSANSLLNLANRKLVELARTHIQLQKVYPNPQVPQLVKSIENLGSVYDAFLDMGLIEDTGYGPFFEAAKAQLESSVS